MSTTSSVPVDTKSAKKRKTKTDAVSNAPSTGRDSPVTELNSNGTGGSNESPYLRELSKNIRNLHKKLQGSAKADAVVEQNPGVSIDELVAQKKLNADQKAQLQKKPQLQAQVEQLEQQHKHYQDFGKELEDKHGKEKAALIEAHEAALAQAKEDATEAAKTTQSADLEKALKTITGFLHAAAAMRQSEDQDTIEARAFEGALLLVYQGNESSLNALRNLTLGSDEKVPDTENNPLDFTYAQVKEHALKDVAALDEDEETATAATTAAAETEPSVSSLVETGTDPTIAHAGLTELEDTTNLPIHTTNGDAVEANGIPEQASTTADAANAVAEANWDPQASMTSTQTPTGDDWVQVPRDPAETETGASQPAPQQSTTNWADEAGAAAEKAIPENDGFEQVKGRDRGGRGRGRGRGFDGRGRGGRGRGDGFRGGRGQGRGGRGGPRGDRAPQPA